MNNCLQPNVSGLLTLPLRPVLGGAKTGSTNLPAGKGLKTNQWPYMLFTGCNLRFVSGIQVHLLAASAQTYTYKYNQYSDIHVHLQPVLRHTCTPTTSAPTYMYTYNQCSDRHVHLQPILRHTCTPATSTPNTCTPTTNTPKYMYTYLQPVLRQTCTSTTSTPTYMYIYNQYSDRYVHLQPIPRNSIFR